MGTNSQHNVVTWSRWSAQCGNMVTNGQHNVVTRSRMVSTMW